MSEQEKSAGEMAEPESQQTAGSATPGNGPKCTPGPWSVEPHHLHFGDCILGKQIWSRPGPRVALTEQQNVGVREEAANAHLIAAAPELYAALEGLLNSWWTEFQDFFGGDAEADAENKEDFDALPAVIDARAALSKARGESQNGKRGVEEPAANPLEDPAILQEGGAS